MTLEKLKETARKYEAKEDWRRAIEVYYKAIEASESGRDPHPDLALYNRVGDLHLRIGENHAAVRAYSRASDLYAEQGFLNNAIALCGKILRVEPQRLETYLKLAELQLRKGVFIEAKRNLVEYVERMNALGRRDAAFDDLKQFADRVPDGQEIRVMLADLFRAASRDADAREQLSKAGMAGGDATAGTDERTADEPEPRGRVRPPSGLVFLDTGYYDEEPAAPAMPAPERVETLESAASLTFIAPADIPATPEGLESATFEGTAEEIIVPLPGLEQTAAELPVTPVDEVPFLAESLTVPTDEVEVTPLAGLESTAGMPLVEAVEAIDLSDLSAYAGLAGEEGGETAEGLLDLELVDDLGSGGAVVEREPMPGEAPPPPEPAGLELLPSPAVATGRSITELEDLILDAPDDLALHVELAERLRAAGERARALEEYAIVRAGLEAQGDLAGALEMAERLVALDPEDIGHHQKRVELAFRTGAKPRLVAAYVALAEALAGVGATEQARSVYGRVLDHDPGNEAARLGMARLSLPTQVEPEPESVLEPGPAPTPQETGAGDAATFAGSVAEAIAEVVEVPAPPREETGRAAAAPAAEAPRAPARPAPGPADGFVDLGSMILEEEAPRDTRMRVDAAEPEETVDEQEAFADILAEFKRGLEKNLDATDFQAHYDLGVAFKEMGLLDEAIAAFQKALRAPEGRLRTSEALGVSFFEKGQVAVAEAVLQRAIDALPGSDDEKIGLIYWLGRAAEAQGKAEPALRAYQRALAVDIGFMDVNDRIQRLSTERQR